MTKLFLSKKKRKTSSKFNITNTGKICQLGTHILGLNFNKIIKNHRAHNTLQWELGRCWINPVQIQGPQNAISVSKSMLNLWVIFAKVQCQSFWPAHFNWAMTDSLISVVKGAEKIILQHFMLCSSVPVIGESAIRRHTLTLIQLSQVIPLFPLVFLYPSLMQVRCGVAAFTWLPWPNAAGPPCRPCPLLSWQV